MDFTPSPRAAELAERVKAFVRDEVIPLELRATTPMACRPICWRRCG